MSNQYVHDLRAVIQQEAHTANEIGDQWRTPDWLYLALNELYGPFVIDLFTDGQNSKCKHYYTADDNALTQDWLDGLRRGAALHNVAIEDAKGFANPPYSSKRASRGRRAPHVTGMQHIMKKAHQEHQLGMPTCWLTKSATSEGWWPDALCSKIIHIKGRIGFDVPHWYRPDVLAAETSSAGFGASVILFDGVSTERQPEEYISRELLMEIGMPLAKISAADRARWVKQWDEL